MQVDINRNAIVELIVSRRIFSEQGKFDKSDSHGFPNDAYNAVICNVVIYLIC